MFPIRAAMRAILPDLWRHPLLFALAYAAVWGGFALPATGAQWGLERAAVLTPDMAAGTRPGSGPPRGASLMPTTPAA